MEHPADSLTPRVQGDVEEIDGRGLLCTANGAVSNGPPYRAGISVFDVMAGLHATIGVLAALQASTEQPTETVSVPADDELA